MTIKENKVADGIELVVEGRLDTGTAPQLEAELNKIPKIKMNLYINLSGIDYVSSAGLRVILLAHKVMLPTGGKMILRSPSAFCMQVLEATGMDKVLNKE
ncbi:STAS domain-containing protein [Treponema sp.]|jgi:anti-sigma B factor antagonist|uniref:STAS domain-containing protein n=1 Tax=Treponema sp. TaxID=166 RepID=UPI0025DB41EE|nr:STAS domain-containing protein [Treponema sp.]MBQ7539181.1 STAS domain-containing protein [Treponema sp.]MBR4321822.1 STAS domain-containing protein [Treponema sp.]